MCTLQIQEVHTEMHSRHHAIGRTYVYRIVCPVSMQRLSIFEYNRCWACDKGLDVAAMREAAAHLKGQHDFSTFRATGVLPPCCSGRVLRVTGKPGPQYSPTPLRCLDIHGSGCEQVAVAVPLQIYTK